MLFCGAVVLNGFEKINIKQPTIHIYFYRIKAAHSCIENNDLKCIYTISCIYITDKD